MNYNTLEKKSYRTDWSIEIAGHNSYKNGNKVMWYRGSIDMDNQHYCSTEEEAEREIDDAIIAEQEAQIEKLKKALRESNACLNGVQDFYSFKGTPLSTIGDQITRNEQALKSIES